METSSEQNNLLFSGTLRGVMPGTVDPTNSINQVKADSRNPILLE